MTMLLLMVQWTGDGRDKVCSKCEKKVLAKVYFFVSAKREKVV